MSVLPVVNEGAFRFCGPILGGVRGPNRGQGHTFPK